MRIAAVADLHVSRTSNGYVDLIRSASREADVLLLPGDLTDYGLPEEAEILMAEIEEHAEVPVVAVLGNHDFEGGKTEEVHDVLTAGGVLLLDGDACEIDGVGFAGVKGFAGGFGRGSLQPWGEAIIKRFVDEAIAEATKLEAALRRLKSDRRVALLHYAPIEATVEGEPREIFPFLGSSRLAEVLDRYPVDFVVHGHAHRGAPEGRTEKGIPVYNVSLPVLREREPDGPGYRILEL